MQVLRILVAVVFLLCTALSSAQQSDQIVSKATPDSCRRNAAQRDVERQEIQRLGGNAARLVAHYCELCYSYITSTSRISLLLHNTEGKAEVEC